MKIDPFDHFSVHPHPAALSRAFADFIKKVGWRSFVILYENEEGLVRLQEVIKMPQTFAGMQVTLRQLDMETNDYRPLLKEIKKSEETRIVLDCDYDKIETILAQANEIELMTDYHNYLITSLDLDKVSVEQYTYQNVNITGFRMINPDSDIVRRYSLCQCKDIKDPLIVAASNIGVPRGGGPGGPWPPLAKIFILAEQNWLAWQKRN